MNSKWNADAEMSMMGFPIPVESTAHLTHMVKYCLKVLKSDTYQTENDFNYRTNEIVDSAMNKYNSSKDKSIKYFVVNDSMFGVMMTFVRDKGELTLKSGKMKANGILAWVENIDAPDCSELGYVFFEKRNGKTVRIG
ncbi:MAG: hypothetical protein IKW20_06265 [Bacteroidales bacterium]|nr:hypothetical protein [Bacteroidales bacterium]